MLKSGADCQLVYMVMRHGFHRIRHSHRADALTYDFRMRLSTVAILRLSTVKKDVSCNISPQLSETKHYDSCER